MTISDELNRLADLKTRGALTEEEFARAKARLLGEPPRGPDGSVAAGLNALRRSRTDRWLGGVCGGIGRITGVESWVWRLIFTVFVLFGGVGLLLYLLLWIFVPIE
ncbi:MAG: PspC domain-containing protein [Gammaproteobacteria bacterium]|nr:PspC domain-containing protein [Gammaproteobacteria bacterium]